MFVSPSPQKSTSVRKIVAPLFVRATFGLGSWLAPETMLERAMRLFSTPSRRSRRRAATASDAGAARFAFDVDGVQIQGYRWGDPATEPYVLIAHGWSDYALRFVPLVEALRSAGYAVVSFDQPGHGRSTGNGATLPQFARNIATVGRRFGRAAAIVGHSMGAAASAIALRDGLAADCAVLIAPPADLGAAADRFAEFVGLAAHLRGRLRRALERFASVRLADFEAHRNVPDIGCPALIVHDLYDREVPWNEGERYARYWPDSRLLSTVGLGHTRILGDAAVVDSLQRFLRGESVGERVVSTPDLPYGFA